MKKEFNIAIFISGHGSNMEAILKYFSLKNYSHVHFKVVISDQKKSLGLSKTQKYQVESTYLSPGKFKTKLEGEAEMNYIRFLKKKQINLICLAGFMRILKKKIITSFPKAIINIHPSLLPNYPGLNTHQRAIENQDSKTGCTIHLVDSGIDTGKIIRQKKVPISPNDTPNSLNKKVIQIEHILYSEVLEDIFLGKIDLNYL